MTLQKRLDRSSKGAAIEVGEDYYAQRPPDQTPRYSAREIKIDKHRDLKIKVHREVIEGIEKEIKGDVPEPVLMKKTRELIAEILERDAPALPFSERQGIAREIEDDVLGLGPIEPLLRDDEITEIMVNGPRQVYVEKDGRLVLTDIIFRDNQHVLHIIDKIVSTVGRRIDESQPMVDARLPDGSRVNAIIPPLCLTGPTLTIRKFSHDPFDASDLIRFGTMTPLMARFLEACVKTRLNLIISGGTGSGKTTLLNVVSSFISNHDRIVTIEDAAELQLHQDHVVTLESRPANVEGRGRISIRDLVVNSLRMRPDRIVVGEVRSGEALDMLQAMNTGHDGSMTTGHANSPRDMLARLETMVLMAGMDLPVRAIREQIAAAVNLIVHTSRMRDGSRKVTHVTEVLSMESDTIVLQDLFRFVQKGVDDRGAVIGRHEPTGIVPLFLDRVEQAGFKIPREVFYPPQ